MSKTSKLSLQEVAKPTKPNVAPKKTEFYNRSYDGDAFVTLFARRGGKDVIILDADGTPLQSTCSTKRTFLYVSNLKPLLFMARNVVRDLDPSNDITFMRIRSDIGEIHMTIGTEFILIIVQRFKRKAVTAS